MDDFNLTYDQNSNNINVSNQVILVCASNATKKTKGVNRIYNGISESTSTKNARKEILNKGIKVSQERDGVYIDVNIIIEYGTDILEVAWNVQKKVKEEVEEITEKKVAKVNVYIDGVDLAIG